VSSKPYLSRPAIESILLDIAKNAVEAAESQQPDPEKGSAGTQVGMENQAVTAVVMLVAALEAFINTEAHERLSKVMWEAIERLDVRNKWIVVSRLATGKEWDRGKEPYQGFHKLVSLRNDLVHYKPKFDEKGDFEFSRWFNEQFTGSTVRKFLGASEEMIKEFFSMIGEPVPDWVREKGRRGIIEGRDK